MFLLGVVRFYGGVRCPALNVLDMNFIQLCCRALLGNGIERIDATHLSYNTISILFMAYVPTWPANRISTFLGGGTGVGFCPAHHVGASSLR